MVLPRVDAKVGMASSATARTDSRAGVHAHIRGDWRLDSCERDVTVVPNALRSILCLFPIVCCDYSST